MNIRQVVQNCVFGAAGLAGVLLAFMGQQLWGDVKENSSRLDKTESRVENQAELLREVRDDVKELLRRSSP